MVGTTVMAAARMGLIVAQDSFEDEFRDWVVDGYGSAALFVLAVLILIALVLRGTRSKY